jgi:hypothetical protein
MQRDERAAAWPWAEILALRRIGARSQARRRHVTLIQTAKLAEIDPQAWRADVLSK